jgi:hypothetical protein
VVYFRSQYLCSYIAYQSIHHITFVFLFLVNMTSIVVVTCFCLIGYFRRGMACLQVLHPPFNEIHITTQLTTSFCRCCCANKMPMKAALDDIMNQTTIFANTQVTLLFNDSTSVTQSSQSSEWQAQHAVVAMIGTLLRYSSNLSPSLSLSLSLYVLVCHLCLIAHKQFPLAT